MIERVLIDTLVTGLPLVPAFLGIYIVLRIRHDLDLSIEGSFALGGAVSGVILTGTATGRPMLAMVAAIAVGCMVGFVTASLHLLLRIPVLLAGLVMNMALFTVTLRVLGVPTVSLVQADTIFSGFVDGPGRRTDVIIAITLAVVVAALLAAFAVFLKSEIGLALRASGVNPRMVRSQGMNDQMLLVLSLMLANGLGGLSGNLMVQVQGFADVNMGTGMFISGVGAVLLGALFLNPSGSRVVRIVLAVAVGSVLYRLILVGALRAGLPAGDLKGITALTLVIAVAAQSYVTPVLQKLRLDVQGRRSEHSPRLAPPNARSALARRQP